MSSHPRNALATLAALGFVGTVASTGLAGPADRPELNGTSWSARSAALRGQRGTVWVTNRSLNSVTVYAAATGRVLATIPVGKEPNDVTVPPGRGKAYVTNEGDNTVSVISTRARRVSRTIPVGPKPHHIETSHNGRRVAFGEFGTNKIGLITTRSDALTEYPASANAAARTHQAYPARGGRTLFATNEVANDIAAVDLRSRQLAFAVAVGERPSEVLVPPDGKRAYVSVRGEDKVKLVHLARRAITREVVVGTQPDTLQLTPDGRTLVVALRGKRAQLVFIDTRRFRASAPLTIAGADTTAAHHFLSANGRFTFAAFEGPAAGVAVVDNRTRRVVATYASPGGGRPHGIHYADPAATSGPAIAIASRLAKVTGARVARIAVRCGAGSIVECRGRLTLRGREGTRLGRGSFAIRAGRRAVVRVKLGRRAGDSLARAGRLRARAVATARDRLGNRRRVTRRIVLRRPG
jgi:YVTN family beta-propeller protein